MGLRRGVPELRERRSYAADVGVGLVEGLDSANGLEHPYLLVVPKSYTPTRRYPVRVHLHGAVDRNAEAQTPPLRRPERFLSEDRITILPAAWSESRWWQASQVENITGILRAVKRTYNVDENRVSLMGISDGGTGTWYFAFRCPTPWASYLSFIGSPSVSLNPSSGAEGAIFLVNVAGKSVLAINGKTDALYPAEALRPAMEAFRKAGADIAFEVEPSDHNTDGGRGESGRSTPSSTRIRGLRCPTKSPGRPTARIAPTGPRGSSSTSSTRPRRRSRPSSGTSPSAPAR